MHLYLSLPLIGSGVIAQQGAKCNTLAESQLQIQTQIYEQVRIISSHTEALSRIEQYTKNTSETLHKVTPDGTAIRVK